MNATLLVSYPKSGNTWTRSIIAALLNADRDLDINNILHSTILSSRELIEDALGFDIEDLTNDEIDCLRPAAYRWRFKEIKDNTFHKVHDAYTKNTINEAIFPFIDNMRVVYVVRNPLDVAVSFSYHNSTNLDRAILNLNSDTFCLCDSNQMISNQVRQTLRSWSTHARSWLEQDSFQVLAIRYEDMKHFPVETFTQVATFLNIPHNKKSILNAIQTCSIEKLQQQEEQHGFREKPPKAERFFRKGMVGDWKNHLSEEQTNQIINAHRDMMLKLGYLDDKGRPCVRDSHYLETINNHISCTSKT
ncbi:sulfotransferase domain-containing protein [Marinomonas mediterranea]|uniref:Sulfotransferase n=1 Tax=Marinomonas mediterranea (strain ATCC 700492 / JCM 21426 / NBRC 103028 / MMB-1) TaxID=717774 RepID=F2JVI2_MARM1|nr:sulfotransferase domain-containing protein [Marinomonas mediterranea]ADZ90526.1 sulfotransferase [Marinomonas mediterranea MMB-1]WCN16705.1 sulfotransferase domain-containing protein [Marinomonas mediterranea MMB-1]